MYIGSNLFLVEWIKVYILYTHARISLSNKIDKFQLHVTIMVTYSIMLSKKPKAGSKRVYTV